MFDDIKVSAAAVKANFREAAIVYCRAIHTLIKFMEALESNREQPALFVFDMRHTLLDEMSVRGKWEVPTSILSELSDLIQKGHRIAIVSLESEEAIRQHILRPLDSYIRENRPDVADDYMDRILIASNAWGTNGQSKADVLREKLGEGFDGPVLIMGDNDQGDRPVDEEMLKAFQPGQAFFIEVQHSADTSLILEMLSNSRKLKAHSVKLLGRESPVVPQGGRATARNGILALPLPARLPALVPAPTPVAFPADGHGKRALSQVGEVAARSSGSTVAFSRWDEGAKKMQPIGSVDLGTDNDPVRVLAVGGEVFAAANAQTVFLGTVDQGPRETSRIRISGVAALAINAAGTRLAVSTVDGRIILYSIQDPSKPLAHLPNQPGAAASLSFGPDGRIVVVYSYMDKLKGGRVDVWDIAQPQNLTLVVTLDGTRVKPDEPTVRARHTATLEPGTVSTARFSSSGRLMVVSGDRVTCWDVPAQAAPARKWDLRVPGALAVAISADGGLLARADPDNKISVFRLNKENGSLRDKVGEWEHQVGPQTSLMFGANNVLAMLSPFGQLFWDPSTGTLSTGEGAGPTPPAQRPTAGEKQPAVVHLPAERAAGQPLLAGPIRGTVPAQEVDVEPLINAAPVDDALKAKILALYRRYRKTFQPLLDALRAPDGSFRLPFAMDLNKEKHFPAWRVLGRSLIIPFWHKGKEFSLVLKGVGDTMGTIVNGTSHPGNPITVNWEAAAHLLGPYAEYSQVIHFGDCRTNQRDAIWNALAFAATLDEVGEKADTLMPLGIFEPGSLPGSFEDANNDNMAVSEYFWRLYQEIEWQGPHDIPSRNLSWLNLQNLQESDIPWLAKLGFLKFLWRDLQDRGPPAVMAQIEKILAQPLQQPDAKTQAQIDSLVKGLLSIWKPTVMAYVIEGRVDDRVEKRDRRLPGFNPYMGAARPSLADVERAFGGVGMSIWWKLKIAMYFARRLARIAWYHRAGGDFGGDTGAGTPKDTTILAQVLDLDDAQLPGKLAGERTLRMGINYDSATLAIHFFCSILGVPSEQPLTLLESEYRKIMGPNARRSSSQDLPPAQPGAHFEAAMESAELAPAQVLSFLGLPNELSKIDAFDVETEIDFTDVESRLQQEPEPSSSLPNHFPTKITRYTVRVGQETKAFRVHANVSKEGAEIARRAAERGVGLPSLAFQAQDRWGFLQEEIPNAIPLTFLPPEAQRQAAPAVARALGALHDAHILHNALHEKVDDKRIVLQGHPILVRQEKDGQWRVWFTNLWRAAIIDDQVTRPTASQYEAVCLGEALADAQGLASSEKSSFGQNFENGYRGGRSVSSIDNRRNTAQESGSRSTRSNETNGPPASKKTVFKKSDSPASVIEQAMKQALTDEDRAYLARIRSEEATGQSLTLTGVQHYASDFDTLTEITAQVPMTDTDTFLDAGSGTGIVALFFAMRFGIASTGVEFDAGQHRIAEKLRNYLVREGHISESQVVFIRGDLMMTDFSPYTVVYCHSGFFDEPDHPVNQAVFRGFAQQMPPGARLIDTMIAPERVSQYLGPGVSIREIADDDGLIRMIRAYIITKPMAGGERPSSHSSTGEGAGPTPPGPPAMAGGKQPTVAQLPAERAAGQPLVARPNRGTVPAEEVDPDVSFPVRLAFLSGPIPWAAIAFLTKPIRVRQLINAARQAVNNTRNFLTYVISGRRPPDSSLIFVQNSEIGAMLKTHAPEVYELLLENDIPLFFDENEIFDGNFGVIYLPAYGPFLVIPSSYVQDRLREYTAKYSLVAEAGLLLSSHFVHESVHLRRLIRRGVWGRLFGMIAFYTWAWNPQREEQQAYGEQRQFLLSRIPFPAIAKELSDEIASWDDEKFGRYEARRLTAKRVWRSLRNGAFSPLYAFLMGTAAFIVVSRSFLGFLKTHHWENPFAPERYRPRESSDKTSTSRPSDPPGAMGIWTLVGMHHLTRIGAIEGLLTGASGAALFLLALGPLSQAVPGTPVGIGPVLLVTAVVCAALYATLLTLHFVTGALQADERTIIRWKAIGGQFDLKMAWNAAIRATNAAASSLASVFVLAAGYVFAGHLSAPLVATAVATGSLLHALRNARARDSVTPGLDPNDEETARQKALLQQSIAEAVRTAKPLSSRVTDLDRKALDSILQEALTADPRLARLGENVADLVDRVKRGEIAGTDIPAAVRNAVAAHEDAIHTFARGRPAALAEIRGAASRVIGQFVSQILARLSASLVTVIGLKAGRKPVDEQGQTTLAGQIMARLLTAYVARWDESEEGRKPILVVAIAGSMDFLEKLSSARDLSAQERKALVRLTGGKILQFRITRETNAAVLRRQLSKQGNTVLFAGDEEAFTDLSREDRERFDRFFAVAEALQRSFNEILVTAIAA